MGVCTANTGTSDSESDQCGLSDELFSYSTIQPKKGVQMEGNVYTYQLPVQKVFNHNKEFSEVDCFSVDSLLYPCELFVKIQVSSLVKRVSNEE